MITESSYRSIPIPDGHTSSAMLINYLRRVFPKIKIQYRIHEGKQHGVIPETVPDDVNLVIIPDAGSNQFEEHRELRQRGIDVIVLDHHEADKYSKDAIVVNNQLSPKYENKDFSGAGITFKFLEALDDKLGLNYASDYIDLVAIGLIADSMLMNQKENRYYVTQGLKNIKNPLIKEIFDAQHYSTDGKINITTTSFYVNPLLNACIRVGTKEEKEQLFEAFLSDGTEEVYYDRGKKYESLITNTVRMLRRTHAKQKRMRDKAVEAIKEKIEQKNLLSNKLLIVEVSDILDENLTGLVANKLSKMNEIQRPTLLVRFNEEGYLSGSGRGYEDGYIKDFRQLLLDTGLFVFVEGHSNAFGVKIEPNNLVKVNNIINKKLKDVELNASTYDVDFEIDMKHFTRTFVSEINDYADIWGRGVEKPKILIKNIKLDKSSILLLGKKKNVIKFNKNGIEFIKFGSSEEEYNNIIKGKNRQVSIDLIGTCSENNWGGKKTQQIRIVDLEAEEMEDGFLF